MKVAVIGAGMAGLSCARRLRDAGIECVLFDKGRSAGGRVATRRRDNLLFNHGAQYATARTDPFSAVLRGLEANGAAGVWAEAGGHDARWTGLPGMSAIPRGLAEGLDVRTGRHVLFLHREADGWHLRHEDAAAVRPGTVRDTGGECLGPFGAVVVAVPAPQAAPLLAAAGSFLAEPVSGVVVDPCWSAMFSTDARLELPDFTQSKEGELATVSRDSARPGRPPGPECWVLHASPSWSREHEERTAEDVAAQLLASLSRLVGTPVQTRGLLAHRWRFSQTRVPLGQPFLWDAGAGLGVCGDWCLGARVEDAFSSGRALAEAISVR